ncbi:MAG: hypothetical protein ACRCXT_00450 [Paraclostridium sp.]
MDNKQNDIKNNSDMMGDDVQAVIGGGLNSLMSFFDSHQKERATLFDVISNLAERIGAIEQALSQKTNDIGESPKQIIDQQQKQASDIDNFLNGIKMMGAGGG